MSPVIIFWLNTLRGTAKAPAVDLLRQDALRGTTSSPVLFIWESPPPPQYIWAYMYNELADIIVQTHNTTFTKEIPVILFSQKSHKWHLGSTIMYEFVVIPVTLLHTKEKRKK